MAEKTDFTRGRKSTFRGSGNGGGNRDATQLGNIDAEVIKYIPKDDMVVVRTTGPVYRAYNGGEIIAPAGSLIAISYEALKAEEGKQFKGTLRNLRTLRDGTQMKYGTGDAMPAQFDKDGNESPTGGSICSFQRVSMPTGNAPTATVNVGGEEVTLPLVTAGIVAGLVSSQQKLIDTRDKDNNVETVPGFAMIPAGDSYISLSSPKYDMDKLDQYGNPRKEQFATVIMSGKGNTRAFSNVNELSDLLKDRAENGMLDMGYADIPLADIATPAAFITAYRKPSDDLSEEAIAEHYADPSNVVTMVVPMFPRWQSGEGDEPGHPYFDVEHSLNRSVEFADPDGDGIGYALQHPEEFDFVMADAARIEIAPSQIPDKVMPGKEAGPKARYQINNAPRSVIYDPEDGKPMQNGYLKVGQGIALVATPSAFYTDKDGKNVTIEKLSFAALKEVADPENSEYPDTAQVRIGNVGARNVMDAVSRLAPMPDGKSVGYNTPIFADQIPLSVPESASPSLKQAIEASQAATFGEMYEEKGGKLVYTEVFAEFGKDQTANRSAHIKNLLNPAAKENKASDPAP